LEAVHPQGDLSIREIAHFIGRRRITAIGENLNNEEVTIRQRPALTLPQGKMRGMDLVDRLRSRIAALPAVRLAVLFGVEALRKFLTLVADEAGL